MAKSSEKQEGETGPEVTPAAAEAPAAAPVRAQIQIDDSRVAALYANFCRVTGTPEELILDFGLNPQPFVAPVEPIVVSQRIITNYFTAKRMLQALHVAVQRHEAAFGVLETDVQKRIAAHAR